MPSPVPPVESSDRKRLVSVAVFLSILFCLLIIRFYQIQIVQNDEWTRVALAQHQYVATEPFMRGSFYSNTSIKQGHPEDEQPFVIDVMKFHLFIDPDSIPTSAKDIMAKQLFDLIGTPAEERIKLRGEFEKKSRSRKVASWIPRDKKEKIDQWWAQFCRKEGIVRNAIYFTSDYQRSYPFGTMLGTVLHTVQEEKDPHTHQALPTGGLEMLLNGYLKGKEGKRQIVRSPRHPLDTGKVLEAPEDGADVYLTINHYLQAIAESELAKGVQAAKAKGGWAVMMDPNTGEILALAQMPSFNPARYWEYYNNQALQEYTKVKAVTDCFEPGSIFKAITVAICLKASDELVKKGQKPLLTPEEWVPSANGWFPGRAKPLKDARSHRLLNMDLAIQKSSNVYMGRIIQRVLDRMGDQWYRNALLEFGFGQKTMIELPAENPGNVPTPGKLHPNGKLEWSVPTPYSLAIGHNIIINSIQMVKSYAILANGGYDIKPHIVRKIVKKKGSGSQILVDNTSLGRQKQIVSSSICKSILRAMKFVTKEGGTSKRADIQGYTEAGKSGTAEKIIDGVYSKDHNVSSFLGIAPAKNPRFVLLVSLDDPEKKFIPGVGSHQYGGVCAAPIFKEIATRSLQYLGVAPDDPYGYPAGDPRRDPKKADWVAEMEALKEAYRKHNE
jgi:cell division protein FtsI (penicillin-binding protein 3)